MNGRRFSKEYKSKVVADTFKVIQKEISTPFGHFGVISNNENRFQKIHDFELGHKGEPGLGCYL